MPTVKILTEGYVRENGTRVAGTISLVQGEQATIVADPGMVADRALILDALRREDIRPEDITHVFISHHHPDHTINIALFPNAEIIDFWATYRDDLWISHGDEYEIDAGITVLRTPGHTEEDASLIVETEEGIVALTHLWWHEDMTPEKDPLAWDQEQLEAHRERLLTIADWIIPGHGKAFKNPHKAG
jgi:glyoxylase-like metal-dependent hydrolase (beta-lactamase superfamily II)